MKGIDDNEVFQAMEALIYNLNSMHSLPGDERIWVYDRQQSHLITMSMEEFHLKFEAGRFAALSLNHETGLTELKEITDSMKHYNFNRILRVNLKSGQTVAVTDNHSIMTMNERGKVVTAHPESLKAGLVPPGGNRKQNAICMTCECIHLRDATPSILWNWMKTWRGSLGTMWREDLPPKLN